MRRRNKREYVGPKPVPADKSRFAFEVRVKGEWDFNRDLTADQYDGDSRLVRYKNEATFKQAFYRMICDTLFDRLDNTIETIGLSYVTESPEIEASYQEMRGALSETERKETERALAETEAQAARLRARLGK